MPEILWLEDQVAWSSGFFVADEDEPEDPGFRCVEAELDCPCGDAKTGAWVMDRIALSSCGRNI